MPKLYTGAEILFKCLEGQKVSHIFGYPGGAIMPTLQGMILDLGGNGYTDLLILGVSEVNFSFTLPLACFLLVFIFAIRARK